nr:Ig-like domain-containing protein [uncultured Ruminococcus sp.]
MKSSSKVTSFMLAFLLCVSMFSIAPTVSAKNINIEKVSGEESKSGNFYYYVDDDTNNATITQYLGNSKSLTIPSTIDGYKVTKVESLAKIENDDEVINTTLETLNIGNNVQIIGSYGVTNFAKLKTVNIKSSVKVVENFAFDGCNALTKINIDNGLKVVYGDGFSNIKNLKSISLPNSVSRVGANAFGYMFDDDTEKYSKVSGFTVSGYTGSNVEKYAKNCSFTFTSLGTYKKSDDETDYLYTVTDNLVTIDAYIGAGGVVTVPEEIDGCTVAYNANSDIFSENQYKNSLEKFNGSFDYVTEIVFPTMWDCFGNISLSDTPKLTAITVTNTEYNFDDEVSENKPFGYSYVFDDDGVVTEFIKNDDFVIKGYYGSTAQQYAEKNDFTFVPIETDNTIPVVPTDSVTETTVNNTISEPSSKNSNVNAPTSNTEVTEPNNDVTIPTEDNSDIEEPTNDYDIEPSSRYVDYPTEPEMKETTYTLPKVKDTNVYVKKIMLNKTKAIVLSDKSVKLVAKVYPKNANNKKLLWTSSNKRIATVEKGVVVGLRKGTVKITVKSTDGSKLSAQCVVTVKQAVKNIKLNKTLITGRKGTKVTLKASVTPTKADNRSVKWQSSNKKIATVSNKGVVTVKGKGYATIKCTSGDGSGVYSKCVVNNSSKAKSVKLNKKSAKVSAGKTLKLRATVKGSCKEVLWKSSNTKVATVTDNGLITAVENGKTVISATTMDGSNKVAKCTVKVVGHNFGEWTVTEEPTCQDEGVETRVCKSCKKTEERTLDTVDHHWQKYFTVDEEPTCTEIGVAYVYCDDCDETCDTYYIPATDHCFGASEIIEYADCETDGLVVRMCKYCDETEEIEIPALGHCWTDEKVVDFEPTNDYSGQKSYHCLYCDATYDEEEIPPLG